MDTLLRPSGMGAESGCGRGELAVYLYTAWDVKGKVYASSGRVLT